MSTLERELAARFGVRCEVGRPLAELTSFRIGGPADLLVTVENEDELTYAIATARQRGVPAFCLGAGTNLLISDRGMRGLVIKLGAGFSSITIDGVQVRAGAAAQFGLLVETVVAAGLAGLEFAEGIPGSVGGGLVMNAGAFGGEMARVVTAVHGVTTAGEARVLNAAEIGFTYRATRLARGFILARVDFTLARGDREILWSRVAELRAKRMARQPRGLPNAGSIFRNPPGNFAGRLLESAGLKGTRIGDAAFSAQHANFIVNLGTARAAEVRALIDQARKQVREATGVWLEPEVKLVGDW